MSVGDTACGNTQIETAGLQRNHCRTTHIRPKHSATDTGNVKETGCIPNERTEVYIKNRARILLARDKRRSL